MFRCAPAGSSLVALAMLSPGASSSTPEPSVFWKNFPAMMVTSSEMSTNSVAVPRKSGPQPTAGSTNETGAGRLRSRLAVEAFSDAAPAPEGGPAEQAESQRECGVSGRFRHCPGDTQLVDAVLKVVVGVLAFEGDQIHIRLISAQINRGAGVPAHHMVERTGVPVVEAVAGEVVGRISVALRFVKKLEGARRKVDVDEAAERNVVMDRVNDGPGNVIVGHIRKGQETRRAAQHA